MVKTHLPLSHDPLIFFILIFTICVNLKNL